MSNAPAKQNKTKQEAGQVADARQIVQPFRAGRFMRVFPPLPRSPSLALHRRLFILSAFGAF